MSSKLSLSTLKPKSSNGLCRAVALIQDQVRSNIFRSWDSILTHMKSESFWFAGRHLSCPCLSYSTAGSQWCISYLTAAAVSSVTFALLDHSTEGDGRPSSGVWQKLKSFKSYTLSEQQRGACARLSHFIFNLLQKRSGKPEGNVKYTDLSPNRRKQLQMGLIKKKNNKKNHTTTNSHTRKYRKNDLVLFFPQCIYV